MNLVAKANRPKLKRNNLKIDCPNTLVSSLSWEGQTASSSSTSHKFPNNSSQTRKRTKIPLLTRPKTSLLPKTVKIQLRVEF